MAEAAYETEAASPERAAPLVGLIEEAGEVAMAHFDTLPPGEAVVYVTLTAATAYGRLMLGMWGFQRTADGAVTLIGAMPEQEAARG
ncbi:hypothetical protein ACWEFD_18110 [Streptomyces ardesiacus]